jgi:hypothetical protein
MDLGLPPGPATVMALADGSASLYMGHGGGVIGAKSLEGIPLAAAELVATANECLDALTPAHEFPLAEVHHTVFYVLTDHGTLTGGGPDAELSDDRHPLAPLFYAGHGVLGIFLDHLDSCEEASDRG